MARLSSILVFLFVLAGTASAQSDAALQEARGLVAEGAYRDAIALLEGAAPLSPHGAYLLGIAYQNQLRHADAVGALMQADTSSARVQAALGLSLDRLGRVDDAEAFYLRAYRADSTDQRIATSLARLYADADRWEDVLGIYERLLEEDAQNAFVHAQLATAYRALDSTDTAIIHYEVARRLNPDDIRVVLQLSGVYFGIEHFISARRVLDAALDLHPRNALLWQRRGDVALKEEEYDKAEESFRAALAYGDSTAAVLRNLGASLYLQNRVDEAYDPLLASFDVDSTDAMTAFYLGMTQKQREVFDEALAYLERATELFGQALLADVHAQVAGTYDLMDETAEAIRVYRLALSLNPAKREVLFHLGALYDEYYADKSVALDHYERFLASVEEGALERMQSYAKQRVAEIREAQFFEAGQQPAPPPAPPADSTKGE